MKKTKKKILKLKKKINKKIIELQITKKKNTTQNMKRKWIQTKYRGKKHNKIQKMNMRKAKKQLKMTLIKLLK